MRLCDRSKHAFGDRRAIYEKQIPSLEIREEEIMGKYRGAPWYSRRLTASHLRQETAKEASKNYIRSGSMFSFDIKRLDEQMNPH